MNFRWIDWNLDHIAKHGVDQEEAEWVVNNARPPYPEAIGDEKSYVAGRGRGGRFVQVVFLLDDDGTAFVIHARPLNDREKRRFRRRSK